MNIGSALGVGFFPSGAASPVGFDGRFWDIGATWASGRVSLPVAGDWNEIFKVSSSVNHSMISPSFMEGKISRGGPEFWGWNEGLGMFPVTFPKV